MAAIPFVEWEELSTTEFAAKQEQFKRVVDNPQKPTTLLIGEIGDFIRSEEFKNKAKEMAAMLYEKTDECVKIRTIITNYSSFYAILWKLNQIFEDVCSELGYDRDGFPDWVEKTMLLF